MQFGQLNRREFITLLSGAATWPHAARAQQSVPVIGMLLPGASGPVRQPAFIQALSENGFVEGRNVEFDFRWGPFNALCRYWHKATLRCSANVLLLLGQKRK
jgi:hypothetical protein